MLNKMAEMRKMKPNNVPIRVNLVAAAELQSVASLEYG